MQYRKFINEHSKLLLGIFLAIYFLLMLVNINTTPLYAGDESTYVASVSELLDSQVNMNNHPLLAKTIWYVIVLLFHAFTGTDMYIFWRIGTVVFAVGTLIVFYKIARLFFTKVIALGSVLLLAIDPMFFSFGRLVQLDVPALFFFLCAIYELFLYRKSLGGKNLLLSAFFVGLSLATKPFAIPVVFIFLIYVLFTKKELLVVRVRKAIVFLFTICLSFLAGNAILLIKNSYYHGNLLAYSYDLFNSQLHLKLESGHPTSPFWSWFVIPQILILYRAFDLHAQIANTIVALQNPFFFAVSLITIGAMILFVFSRKVRLSENICIVLFCFMALYLIWGVGLHDTYYYYIIPIIPLIILLFCYILTRVISLSKYLFSIFVGILILNFGFFLFYYPLLVGIPMSRQYESFAISYSQYKYPARNTLFCQFCSPFSYPVNKYKINKK